MRAPIADGASRLRIFVPSDDSKSEWSNGNCASNIALAKTLQGSGTRPRERFLPEYIATIIVPTPKAKNVWHTAPYPMAIVRCAFYPGAVRVTVKSMKPSSVLRLESCLSPEMRHHAVAPAHNAARSSRVDHWPKIDTAIRIRRVGAALSQTPGAGHLECIE
jgi:hypothetical protein